ncbi:hypothetical protein [Sphingomonas sp. CROZ-RG-20F-R02-07]|uniref:hypothetical protein n=1 Tax=Sphingomonas sp. CROZ-RG-20F-R02-07 TaxID=2914832 RepID=UPI001F575BC0|nr:hypothetical protein [Sphingomonas sp. CROZ-RG-20F-R02-07]
MRMRHPSENTPSIVSQQGHRFGAVDATSRWLEPAQHFARLDADYSNLLQKALVRSDAPVVEKKAVRQICGLTRHQRSHGNPMSHLRMRRRAGLLLYRTLRPIWLAHPDRVWAFGTFIPDVGNSLEYAPHVELFRVKRDTGKMLAAVGMHAVGVTELQLGRFPGKGAGRTVQAHVHTLGYFDDPVATLKGAEATLARGSTSSNWLGASVADFRPVTSLYDLKYRCRYMFKAPLQSQFFGNDREKRSGKYTKHTEALDPSGALLLMQILSHITLGNATTAHGDLVKPKGLWIRQVSSWTKAHPVRKDFDYRRAFQRVWENTRTRKKRAEPVIRFDAKAPLDLQWNAAMQPLFSEVAASQARHAAARAAAILDRKMQSPTKRTERRNL